MNNQPEPISHRSQLGRFYLLALLLVWVPLPFLLAMEYFAGGIHASISIFVAWSILAVLYWWPVGAVMDVWKRGWVSRLAVGYVVSLPLYFLVLYLVYPAFNGHFHPSSAGVWGIYFSQTPIYFAFVAILLALSRSERLRGVATWLVAVLLGVGIVAPIIYATRVDRYTWPASRSTSANIVNARLVDAANNQIVDGFDVHIKDGRITELVSATVDSSQLPKIEAGGQYLLPGLIDVHVHLQAPVRSILAPFDFKFLLDSLFSDYAPHRRALLESGVTAVRDCGGPAAHAYEMRADLQADRILGPRLFVVGKLVTSPHGHPVSTIWDAETSRQGAILAHDSASLLDGLQNNYDAGPPDAAKFIYGTIGRAKEKLDPRLLEEGIAWAKSKNLISVVHAETTDEVTEAAHAGATGIEHVASIESLPDELASLLLEKKTFVDPTFGELNTALTLRDMPEAQHKEILQQRYQFIRKLQQAGVLFTVGTDAPLVPYGTGLHDEFDDYLAAGFSPAQILTFDTVNNAAYLGKSDTLGRIAPGYDADLLLVKENPLQNIETLRKPTWVMLSGQLVAGPGAELKLD